ncbi:CCA tRNA nucleotidyltransferase [Listeria monocytogenes]|uniref:CCA tRNA nucleotidyltransferase n=1 Tax=Listeria monocytogenes TaxID=1639 RepID=UPI000397B70C|nr:CCA tRNA nucleotidyltransferase [Listeria monocytogenes]EAG6332093.1 CCA tRNA nucleotidyltransferase [Listeria monocytogenes CFSAN002346]EAG6373778.1 CCA tRNA nucleotidyltransferase [Listeria monocytogenes CFSAN002356]EGC3053223.1 CCA tRNA nucleotidyltransferase [Listeria monocytogenes CFSAN002357]MCZ17338.1 CCA tRNA nucleotidyltransferase [Listeria monocytogenes serotype 4b]AKP39026.1 CCA tRNA nucleotidyltransferase [Listeria monocytogenes]
MNDVFLKALPVLQKLTTAGFEAYFVGGSVRDYLLNRMISDVDIATSAFPEEVKEIFQTSYDTGIAHGTVTVRENNEFYEVTTFRTEGTYEDFRRPSEVTFIRSLEEDLKRRDFTMNAIAMDEHFALQDPFSGQLAIQNKEIKAVGKASERFHEDALRMMRAVRFLSQLDFELDKETEKALESQIELLQHTSVERITVEWLKMMKGKAAKRAIELLLKVKMETYLPGLKDEKSALSEFASWDWEKRTTEESIWLGLVVAVKPNNVNAFLKAWKLPNKTIQLVNKAYQYALNMKETWLTEELYHAGKAVFSLVNELNVIRGQENNQHKVSQAYEALPIHSKKDLAITGADLLKWSGESAGPWVKETLDKVECGVLSNEINNEKIQIKRWLGYHEE